MDKSNIEYYAGTDLQLCVRSFNILKRAGINTIQDLYELSLIDLYGFCRTENGKTSPVDYVRLLEDIAYLFQNILISK